MMNKEKERNGLTLEAEKELESYNDTHLYKPSSIFGPVFNLQNGGQL